MASSNHTIMNGLQKLECERDLRRYAPMDRQPNGMAFWSCSPVPTAFLCRVQVARYVTTCTDGEMEGC
jgi:hypothetical protein